MSWTSPFRSEEEHAGSSFSALRAVFPPRPLLRLFFFLLVVRLLAPGDAGFSPRTYSGSVPEGMSFFHRLPSRFIASPRLSFSSLAFFRRSDHDDTSILVICMYTQDNELSVGQGEGNSHCTDKMRSYRLTRHLYALDEVALTLLTALLTRRDLDECYYWIAEIAASGFDVFPWLWWIYYSFYADLHPRLEGYMRLRGSSGSFRDACAVIRNMYRATPTATVFLLDQAARSARGAGAQDTAGAGTVECEFPNYPVAHQAWLRCVKHRDMVGAVRELIALAEAWCPSSLFRMLFEFHAEYMGAKVDSVRMEQYWHDRPGADDVHHIISIMVHLLRAPGEYSARKLFIAPRDDSLAYLSPGEPFGPPNQLLAAGRKYPTGEGLQPFLLARHSLDRPALEVLRHNWEYYSFGCPLWRTRMLDCGAVQCHQTRCVEFRTDEGLEAFYALYGVDPDEQPLALQMLSVGPLSGGSSNDWMSSVFGENGEIVPPDWKWDIQIDNYFR